jgi:8-oxo-dGTP pyrophosphatase MutT (NUDIX family)
MPHKLTAFVEAATCFDPADSMQPLTVNGALVGWMKRSFATHLENWPEHFSVRQRGVGMLGEYESAEHRSQPFATVVESLAAAGIIKGWRGEQVAVAESFYEPTLFYVERAASRYFGFTMYASHLNGITLRDGTPHMWIARRAQTKHLDPGMLDNIAAGRIARAHSPRETLIKESFEEAGITEDLAQLATSAGAIKSRRAVDEGLHHEIMFVYDLMLPNHFVPQNQDGEVKEFLCVSIPHLMGMLEHGANFTIDAALVIVDYLLRHGHINPDRDDYLQLIHHLRP